MVLAALTLLKPFSKHGYTWALQVYVCEWSVGRTTVGTQAQPDLSGFLMANSLANSQSVWVGQGLEQ